MTDKRPAPNWKALREALWMRCDGRCEVTGLLLDFDTFDAHHRRPKGMGGTYRLATDSLPNLLALDSTVHNGSPQSVHQDPTWSRPRGYLLHAGVVDDDLAKTPLLYRGTDWVTLDDDLVPERLPEHSQRHLSRMLALADEAATGSLSMNRARRNAGYRQIPRPYGQYS